MKTAALLISAVIIIGLMPWALTSIDDFRQTDYENQFDVTTGAGDTTESVILSQDLFGDETANAVVTSNISADAPIVSSYTSSNNSLTITGLAESSTRRLTVDYKIDALTDYYAASTGAKIWPMLLILGVIGIIAAAVYSSFRRGE